MKNLHNGDCIPFLKSLESQSVDFTFYDPPYNVGKDYGVHKDNLPPEVYRQWMFDVANEAIRLSRRGVAVYVCSDLNKLFYDIFPNARLIPIHKRAAGIVKDNISMQYHSLFVVGKPVIKCKDLWDDVRLPGEGYFFKEERFDHPGQTAQALIKKVLYHFTQIGDVVLDPFLGIGSSALVALSMGRSIVGCENNPKYFSIAESRIKSAELQPSLPTPPNTTWSGQENHLPLT